MISINQFVLLLIIAANNGNAFMSPVIQKASFCPSSRLSAKKSDDGAAAPVQQNAAFMVGSLVEFVEKKRTHVAKILSVEHKSSGGARYHVEDTGGKTYDVAEKAINFHMPAPNDAMRTDQLLLQFEEAQTCPELTLREKLEVSPDLLEMAWEEVSQDPSTDELTPAKFVQLMHSHTASQLERYMAWRLLKHDMAHVFFKELKQNGRVVAFKAKASKAVKAAKEHFCKTHADEYEFCFV
jgi:hypothetical protein